MAGTAAAVAATVVVRTVRRATAAAMAGAVLTARRVPAVAVIPPVEAAAIQVVAIPVEAVIHREDTARSAGNSDVNEVKVRGEEGVLTGMPFLFVERSDLAAN
jgi:hypothetical protein